MVDTPSTPGTTTSGVNAKPSSAKPKTPGEATSPGALASTTVAGSEGSVGGSVGSVSEAAGSGSTSDSTNRRAEARTRFSSALEEARAGLDALRADAKERGANYRSMATDRTTDWVDEVKTLSGDARKRAEEAANAGKSKASDGLSALGRVVSDTASVIDERLGAKYGDYARSAARSMQESAARLEAKELGELGQDVREFVRKSPGTALGIAAVTGFFIARLFGAGGSKE